MFGRHRLHTLRDELKKAEAYASQKAVEANEDARQVHNAQLVRGSAQQKYETAVAAQAAAEFAVALAKNTATTADKLFQYSKQWTERKKEDDKRAAEEQRAAEVDLDRKNQGTWRSGRRRVVDSVRESLPDLALPPFLSQQAAAEAEAARDQPLVFIEEPPKLPHLPPMEFEHNQMRLPPDVWLPTCHLISRRLSLAQPWCSISTATGSRLLCAAPARDASSRAQTE